MNTLASSVRDIKNSHVQKQSRLYVIFQLLGSPSIWLEAVPKPLRAWALPTLGLLFWLAHDHLVSDPSAIAVTVESVLRRAQHLLVTGELQLAIQGSLWRLMQGLALGVSLGFLLGALLGVSRLADKLLGPSFNTFKQISLFAWIPLMSIWFGMGDTGKVVFLAMAAFFPMVINTYEGIRSVPHDLLEVARAMRLSALQVLRLIIVPSATPSLFTGLYLAMIYAWLAGIGAEYLLSASPGVGTLLVDGQELFLMDQIIVGVIVVGIIGLLMNLGAAKIERRLLLWRGQSTANY